MIVVQWSEEGLCGTFQKQGNEDRTVEESIPGLLKKDSSLREVKTPDQLMFRLRARERRTRQKKAKKNLIYEISVSCYSCNRCFQQ